ncbi:hypothetical protein FRB94_002217 [Tulasnella sp. JGI-2019a]|nr:hypothetical protein FRB94_002217 [Tulasnella sp. JGI-2019a]KAG9000092.1 hypothetical protein FRB93_012856 [Tulasnella sp. JGI-2019a]
METPVKRKVVDTGNRSAANTPTPGHRPLIKAKVQVSSVAQVRTRLSDRGASPGPPRARSPLKVKQDASRLIRSSSPGRITAANSSPVTRVTSPELSTVGRGSSQRVVKAKTSAFAISQRASPTARVIPMTSPSPYARVSETQGGSPSEVAGPSAASLPPSPALKLSPLPIGATSNGGIANLQPRLRGHIRTSSLSDTSSLPPHSPSSSSLGTGTYDGNSEVGASSSRMSSVLGFSSNGIDNLNVSPTSPTVGPSVRIKSKVSSFVISTSPPNGNGNSPTTTMPTTLSFPALHQNSLSRKSSLSSASARPSSILNHRQRTPSTSSGVAISAPLHSPPPPLHRQSSASGTNLAMTVTTSRMMAKPIVNNIHYNNYQPFPIPSLPAPPAPDAIGDVLHASPLPKSPPLASGWPSSPKAQSLYAPLRPRSGTATSDHPTKPGSNLDMPSSFESPPPQEDQSSRTEDESSGQAEARSNRKIADLEITNRSLMSINAMLEATKVRQAKEIRDLRRRLRETRLILPPRAFAAFKNSDTTAVAAEEALKAENDDDDEDSDVAEGEVDLIYDRITGMLERMLGHAKEAVDRVEKPEEVKDGMVKVLSAAEMAEVYHDAAEDEDGGHDEHQHDHDHDQTDFEDEGTSFNTGVESLDGDAESGIRGNNEEASDNGSEAEVEDLIERGRESFASAQSHLSLEIDHDKLREVSKPSSTSSRRPSIHTLPLLTVTAGTPTQTTRPELPLPLPPTRMHPPPLPPSATLPSALLSRES